MLLHIPAYLDLPLTANLVTLLTLSLISTWLDLQLWCHSGWDLEFFGNSDLFDLPSFFLKVFLKLLSGAKSFFTLHFCFQIREHMLDAKCHAMYDRAWMSEHLNFFLWICFIPRFRICHAKCHAMYDRAFYGLAPLAYYASVLSLKRHFVLVTPYRVTTSLCSKFMIFWFLHRRKTNRLSLALCWILILNSTLSIKS